jgi:hypothetical protein
MKELSDFQVVRWCALKLMCRVQEALNTTLYLGLSTPWA